MSYIANALSPEVISPTVFLFFCTNFFRYAMTVPSNDGMQQICSM